MNKLVAITVGLLLLISDLGVIAFGQSSGEIRGTVTDESGALVVAASVSLDDGKGRQYSAQTDEAGRYRITGIVPAVYTVTVIAEGFAKFENQVDFTSKRVNSLDVTLKVVISEEMEVREDSAGISTEPDKNLSAVTISGKELEALPDDPDELLATLRQLAGTSGDASVYVDGFREGGRLPPKETIQMIRLNSNPFSAEFAETGFSRIEIITRPGSDRYHGGFRFNFNDESLNARHPLAPSRDALQTRFFSGYFNGPIIRNRWGFSFDMDRREIDDNEIINATVLNPITLFPEPFAATVLTPSRSNSFSMRSDYLLTKKHTLGLSYRRSENESFNHGGAFDLPERASTRHSEDNTLRFSLTTIATERSVNELRLELTRRNSGSRAVSSSPAINVIEAFNSGGNQNALFSSDTNESLELIDNVTYTYNKHVFKFGIRADGVHRRNESRANFGGTFTFGSDFERDSGGQVIRDADGEPISISPLEHYRRTVLELPGYRPSQFSIVRGDPLTALTQWEMAWFAQDDWRISPTFTLSYGLRHEFQTHLNDKINFAPRLGFAWQPHKAGTIRGGTGLFYNRLDDSITFDTIRLDGSHQLQFTISQPLFFPDIPDVLTGASVRQPTIRTKDEELNAPYTIMTTIGYDRQLPWRLAGSVNYTWQRSVHLLRTRNINAPQVVAGGPPQRLFPDQGPILQYETSGFSNRHEFRFNLRTTLSRTFTMFGNYTLGYAKSDTEGAGTTPANPFDLSGEYGRAAFDVRHRFFVGGSVTLPWGFRLNPFVNISSGRPFNITTGRDNNVDLSFSDRPSFALPGDPGAIVTPLGTFNPNPGLNDLIIPRNLGEGPGQVSVNLNISKTFGFGAPGGNNFSGRGPRGEQTTAGGPQTPQQGQAQSGQPGFGGGRPPGGERRGAGGAGGRQGGGGPGGFGGGGGGGPRGGGGGGGFGGFGGGLDARNRYSLTFAVDMQNILNHTNFGNANGALTSPFFGRSNTAQPARRISLSLRFGF